MAAFAVLCVCSSCSKDDEGAGEANYEELIVGTWKTEKSYDVESGNFEYDERTVAEFKSNGKVTMSYDDGGSAVVNWRITNSTLYLELEGEMEAYKINKLNKEEMEITYMDQGEEIEVMYFTRVK